MQVVLLYQTAEKLRWLTYLDLLDIAVFCDVTIAHEHIAMTMLKRQQPLCQHACATGIAPLTSQHKTRVAK